MTTEDTQQAAAPATALMHSPESEKQLLSTLLNENRSDLFDQLLSSISSKDLHTDEHAAIWHAIQTLHESQRPHDAVAVIDFARSSKTFVGGAEFIFNLAEDPVAAVASPEAIKGAAKRVKSLSVRRSLKQILANGHSLCEKSEQDFEQVLSLVEDDLLNLRKTSESSRTGPSHVKDGLDILMDRLVRQMDGEQIGVGITTGFEKLDEITSGFIDEDFIIIAARPSMGKTAFLLNVARNGANAGRPALIFSLEMRQAALAQRLLGREGRIPLSSLRTAEISNEAMERLSEGLHKLASLPIWIDDTPGLSIHEIRSRTRAFVAEHGKCTVFVDYIQHVAKRDTGSSKGQLDEKGHVSDVSKGMKGIARELKIPVVGLSQLNRGLEQRANKRPIMSDLRESGALEQDADLIMFLYRDEVYNADTKEPGICEVIIGKQRDGAIGVVPLSFQKEIGMFQDLSY